MLHDLDDTVPPRWVRIDCEFETAHAPLDPNGEVAIELWLGAEAALRYCMRFENAAGDAPAPDACLPPGALAD